MAYLLQANVTQVDVNIPHKHHNALIGAKGRLIRSIMDECGGVSIKFPPEGTNSDKVLIRGPKDDVEKAKKQLLQLLTEKVIYSQDLPRQWQQQQKNSNTVAIA